MKRAVLISSICLVGAWFTILVAACARPTAHPPTTGAEDEPRQDSVRSLDEVARGRVCNVCYAHNWQSAGARGYGSDTSEQSLAELDQIGVGAVSLTAFGWMHSLDDTSIRMARSPGSETFDRLRVDAARAHELGMNVMIKPHLWIRGGQWRGDIAPDPAAGGWDTWFDSYESFILEHARFAEEVDAEWFCVGVELVSSTREHAERWRAIIAAVRDVYSGQLVYAANWDEVEHVRFHDALDAVGVQHFAPLADAPGADLASMRRASQRWLDRWSAIAAAVDRPLMLTEVGFMNRTGGAVEPWVWPEHLPDVHSVTGDREQRDAYLATIDTFGQADVVVRIYWWKWFSDPETDEEGAVGFSPRGKPAGDVLRSACGGRP